MKLRKAKTKTNFKHFILIMFTFGLLGKCLFAISIPLVPDIDYVKEVIKQSGLNFFTPYILELNQEKGGVVYYGSYHNVNLKHPQFNDIEKRWNEYKPDIAFSEGQIWPLIKSRDKAIKKYGEQGLLRYLANRDRIKIKCIEPSKQKEIKYLKRFYTMSKIKIFYILRQLIISKEILERKISHADHVKILIKNYYKNLFDRRYPRNYYEFNFIVKQLLPDLKDWERIDSKYFMDIRNKNNWLAKMNAQLNKFRDMHMFKKINMSLKKGLKVFAVVGKNHVISQENQLLKKPNLSVNKIQTFE